MGIFLYTIHVITSLFLILVVLLQQGKGADLSVFGGGATMTAFGARGAASLLHRLTVGGFVIFIVTTLGIGIHQSGAGGSVMGDVPAGDETPAATATTTPEAEETSAPPAGVQPEAGGALQEAPAPTLGPDAAAGEATNEPPVTGSDGAAGEGDG